MIEKILIRVGTVIAVLGAIGAIVTIHVRAYDNFQLSDFALFIAVFDCLLGVMIVCFMKIWRTK